MRDFTEFIEKYHIMPYDQIPYDLCLKYNNDFDLWFDKDKFDWNPEMNGSLWLCVYCSEHFDKWFDKEKFNWIDSYALCEHCSEHFDKWFDKNLFNWLWSYLLFRYCSKYLTNELIWECRDKIDWEEVNKRHIPKSIKTKLKIAGYL